MKNIKAIIFDAYGTLFDVNSAAGNRNSDIFDNLDYKTKKKNHLIKSAT